MICFKFRRNDTKYAFHEIKAFFVINYLWQPNRSYMTIFIDIALLASNPPLSTINKYSQTKKLN